MFEGIKESAKQVVGNEPGIVRIPAHHSPKDAAVRKSANSVSTEAITKKLQQAEKAEAERKQAEAERRLTEQMLEELEQDIESIHNIGLRFAKHDATGRTIVTVLDKESNEVIREIPSKDILDLAAKMEEMVGFLLDKKA